MKRGKPPGSGEPQDNFNRELHARHAVAGEGGNHAKTFNPNSEVAKAKLRQER